MEKFGIKEVMDVCFYDTKTGKPVIFFDTLKLSELENKASESAAKGGKGNPKLLIWDFDREATMKIQDALLSPKSFSLLAGTDTAIGTAIIQMRQSHVYATDPDDATNMIDKGADYPLTASGAGAVELAYTPLETASNILVYDADDDGGTPLTAGTLSGKTLTNASWASKKLVVYYTYNSGSDAQTFTISADKFPSTYKIVGDTVIRNATTGKDEPFQVVIPKAKLQPSFTMSFKADGDPSAFDMNVEILRPAGSATMISMIKY